ncbi:MAG: hypothetical protein ACE5HN_03695, partial [Nitrospiria bacterium]
TILKVPHHGSHSSSSRPFLEAASPKVAVISVGSRNRYRHPRPEILSRYELLDVKVYRTDQDGALIVEANRTMAGKTEGPTVQSYREMVIEKVKWNASPGLQEWNNLRKVFSIPFLD